MRITLGNTLPPYPDCREGIRRAPDRGYKTTGPGADHHKL